VEDEGDEVSVSFLILVGMSCVGPNAAFSGLFVDSDGTLNDDGCTLTLFFEGGDVGK
jgi:hypothetical protein